MPQIVAVFFLQEQAGCVDAIVGIHLEEEFQEIIEAHPSELFERRDQRPAASDRRQYGFDDPDLTIIISSYILRTLGKDHIIS